MRLTTIEFSNYKRLESTSCNVEGRILAFIGPNESGKSSVLEGLRWLSSGTGALPVQHGTRRSRPEAENIVVRARFKIDPTEINHLAALALDTEVPISKESLTEFRVSRLASGTRVTGLTPAVKRRSAPFDDARRSLESLFSLVQPIQDEIEQGLGDALDATVQQALVDLNVVDQDWSTERHDRIQGGQEALSRIADRLDEVDGFSDRAIELRAATDDMDIARIAAQEEDPDAVIRRYLLSRTPQFILFTEDDRAIASRYNLADEEQRSSPPAPLSSLLAVAGTTPIEVWEAMQVGGTELRSLQKRLNAELKRRLTPMWTQSGLAVDLALDESGRMEVSIDEIENPELTVTSIDERSDGLRTFLGLVCFLASKTYDVPPVLMIDEAERNLHYDAQADLVRVLTRDLNVSKVIYTTHSPGCLPLDIGTGIRVVARHPTEPISTLENDFWTKSEPNFSRLLFAMGAEASAFSAFRHAVLAEGVSEMLLLPTLLRNASDQEEVAFQVAPGLSNLSLPRDLGNIALKTIYLVDGDHEGNLKRSAILEAGIPQSHIMQLPAGQAVEDLVDRDTYLDCVDGWLADQYGPEVTLNRDALDAETTIAHAVDLQLRSDPRVGRDSSHKIIAFRLALLGEELGLAPGAKEVLQRLRRDCEQAFISPAYHLSAQS